MTRSNRTPEEMYPLIASYLEGSMTQKDFCSFHNLPLCVFTYWLRKYRQEHERAAPVFQEISAPISEAFAEIRFTSGSQLRLLLPVPAHYLLALVQ